MRLFVIMAVACVAVGCHSSTAPTSPVAGDWNYTLSNGTGISLATGDSLTCKAQSHLRIAGDGSKFEGTYSGFTIKCTSSSAAGNLTAGPDSGNIVAGALNGTSVQFRMDSNYYNAGAIVNSTTMSGLIFAILKLGAEGEVQLTGAWLAVQPVLVSE